MGMQVAWIKPWAISLAEETLECMDRCNDCCDEISSLPHNSNFSLLNAPSHRNLGHNNRFALSVCKKTIALEVTF